MFCLQEITIFTACALHDAQNSFRWAMTYRYEDKDVLKDCYIALEGLRHMTDTFANKLAEFVCAHVNHHEGLNEVEKLQYYDLYLALGVDTALAKLLAYTFELYVIDRQLYMAKSCLEHPELHATLVNVLLDAWRFRQWNEARFLNVGRTCKVILVGLLTGLEHFIDFAETSVSNVFYINGFRRLMGDGRKAFVAMSAIVSTVP
jgi:hypothetical protein